MKYLVTLFLVFTMNANAIPVLWTLEDPCAVPSQPAAILCGSFVFDAGTGIYSDIDIWFGIFAPPTIISHHHDSAIDGDRFFLELSRGAVYAGIRFVDLAVPEPQAYRWSYGGQPIVFTGGGTLTPDYSAPMPVPGTLALICVAFISVGWARRQTRQ